MNAIYKKALTIKSHNNTYELEQIHLNDNLLKMSLIIKDNENILNIFNNEFSLNELKNGNNFFNDCNSIKEIIDFLLTIVKNKKMEIVEVERNNNDFYYLIFYNELKNNNYKFKLNNVNQNNEINIISENPEKISVKKSVIESQNLPSNYNHSIFKSSLNIDSNMNVYKENNNNIFFTDKPKEFNEKKIIYEYDTCNNFTAFENCNGHNLVAWTIKNKYFIFLHNFSDEIGENYKINAHNSEIDSLQYFHEHNSKEDFIISFSKLDIDTLKFWKIQNERNIEFKMKFNKISMEVNIDKFCIFNRKYFNNNSYIFFYGKLNDYSQFNQDDNKYIFCCMKDIGLNNKINKNDIFLQINSYYNIIYMDTFYFFDDKELYLMNCTNENVEIIKQPFDSYSRIYFSKGKPVKHLSAFIVERYGFKELFEINQNEINIWDIDNNIKPKLSFYLRGSFLHDIILWNKDYILLSEKEEFMFVKVSNNKLETKLTQHIINGPSKVRKINLPKEKQSIVGIDDGKLCLWPIISDQENIE